MPDDQDRQSGEEVPAAASARRRFRCPSCEGLTWLAVLVGVVLRIWEYAQNRVLYMDERFLLENLTVRAVFDLWTPLTEFQLAPPVFLVVERLMVRLPIDHTLAARLVPLFCGIASMVLMPLVARRYVDRRAVPIATALFALAEYLLYYSAEIKQYSCDVMFTLIALLLAARRVQTRTLAIFGAVGAWCSHPLVFVLAGVGVHRLAAAALRKEWREATATAAMGVLWVASFGACFAVSRSLLKQGAFIWEWWNFAFLPIPPRTPGELSQIFWQLVNVTNNPSGVLTPLSPPVSAFVALGFFLVGAVALGWRWRGGLFLLLAPAGFALVASTLHKYPFHGRLLLFLVPTVHLLIAEGIATVGRRAGWLGTVALVAFMLYRPAANAVWHYGVMQRNRPYDSHGDLTSDLLDYFEAIERRRAMQGPGGGMGGRP